MSFSLDLSKFSDLTEKKMELLARRSAIGLFTDIIKDTPVLQGRLKGNWQPDINKFAEDTSLIQVDKSSKGKHSAESKSKLANKLKPFKIGETMTLTNNMPYAERIEFEGWSKNKAPQGMVRINIVKWQKHLDEQARKLNG